MYALLESHNLNIAALIKECDHAIAKYKVLKKETVEFGAVHAQLSVDFENLNKAHKALESELSKLTKSHEQLQIQLNQVNIPSTSTSSCDHANIIEENARLKKELANLKGKGPVVDPLPKQRPIVDPLTIQRPYNSKEGLGYVAKPKKKNHKKKAKPVQAKKNNVVGGNATRGKATHDDFAGNANTHYVLFCDYYGDVYASFVGPFDSNISWSIWVPKTLITNMRGPIEKWVPKTKT